MTGRHRTWNVATFAVLALALFGCIPALAASDTLKAVKERGHLICGVSEGLVGFSTNKPDETWSGFDVDFCRAVSAAIFGSPDKVEFVQLTATERFDALTAGKIDLLSRNTTWTLQRDIVLGLDFAGVSYYDGQGFLTRVENGISSALQLAAARICVLKGTTSESNAKAYFEQHNVPISLMSFERRMDALAAYEKRECDVYSADKSALASERTKLDTPSAHVLLPEVISKEPLGPVVKKGDPAWTGLVRWVLFLLINAEEREWTAASARASGETAIEVPEDVAKILGVPPSWHRDVIAAVGHYGEIFDRNIGKDSPLELGRGMNALWSDGGILYAPPMR